MSSSDTDSWPPSDGTDERIVLGNSDRFPVAPHDKPMPESSYPNPLPPLSSDGRQCVAPGAMPREPILDPWQIWDDTACAPQAQNPLLPELEVTEADADPSFEGWAYISKQGRRWRVPTGPGFPSHPSVHNGHLAAPEPPPRIVGSSGKAFQVRPARWELVLRNNEYYPVLVPAALSSSGSLRTDTASPQPPFLTPEQKTAGPHWGMVSRDDQFPGIEDPVYPWNGTPPWTQGRADRWLVNHNERTVQYQPSPWVADQHEVLNVHNEVEVAPAVFPAPGSILVTRLTPPPDSVQPFDQINLRIEPVTTVLEAQQAAEIQPQITANTVSQTEVDIPASEQSFYPEWIDNSLFREEERVSALTPIIPTQEAEDELATDNFILPLSLEDRENTLWQRRLRSFPSVSRGLNQLANNLPTEASYAEGLNVPDAVLSEHSVDSVESDTSALDQVYL